MPSDRGLKIIQQLLANTTIIEANRPKHARAKSVPLSAPQDPATRRYIRTPEYDSRFEWGRTYRDTHTGRICWQPDDVDPNEG